MALATLRSLAVRAFAQHLSTVSVEESRIDEFLLLSHAEPSLLLPESLFACIIERSLPVDPSILASLAAVTTRIAIGPDAAAAFVRHVLDETCGALGNLQYFSAVQSQVDDEHLRTIAVSRPPLASVRLGGCSGITSRALLDLLAVESGDVVGSLRAIDVSYVKELDSPQLISALSLSSKILSEIIVSGCDGLGRAFFQFALSLPVLRTLCCSGCVRFDQLPAFMTGGLERLDISGLKFLPATDVAALAGRNRSTLVQLCLNECDADVSFVDAMLHDCKDMEGSTAGLAAGPPPLLQPPRCSVPLQHLEISWCERLASHDVTRLVNCTPNLLTLRARCLELGDAVLFSLASSCPLIQEVDLDKGGLLTDEGIAALCERCVDLRNVNFGWSQAITDVSPALLLRSLPNLHQMDLAGCKSLSAEGLLLACVPRHSMTVDARSLAAAPFPLKAMDLSWVNAASTELVERLRVLLPLCAIRDYYTEVVPPRVSLSS